MRSTRHSLSLDTIREKRCKNRVDDQTLLSPVAASKNSLEGGYPRSTIGIVVQDE
jgi:hypothetical protein